MCMAAVLCKALALSVVAACLLTHVQMQKPSLLLLPEMHLCEGAAAWRAHHISLEPLMYTCAVFVCSLYICWQRGTSLLTAHCCFHIQHILVLYRWYIRQTLKHVFALYMWLIREMLLPHSAHVCSVQVVYKRYASLYFVMGIDSTDNELITLELVHHFVEVLDRYFGNVCELDLIFNFHKVHQSFCTCNNALGRCMANSTSSCNAFVVDMRAYLVSSDSCCSTDDSPGIMGLQLFLETSCNPLHDCIT